MFDSGFSHATPQTKANLSNVKGVATGDQFGMALLGDGTVQSWGRNNFGALGTNAASGASVITPTTIPGLTDVVGLASGSLHSLALLSNGTVKAWGFNGDGQLGDGTIDSRFTPVDVINTNMADVVLVETGRAHSMALLADGTVRTWGSGNSGKLGDGTGLTRTSPVQASGVSDVVALEGGFEHSLAVRSDGKVYIWGQNNCGQLGNGFQLNLITPIINPNLSGVIGVAAGRCHSLALLSDSTLKAFGESSSGQLGNNSTAGNLSTPVTVLADASGTQPPLSGVASIHAGTSHTSALMSDGTVRAWGQATANGSASLSALPITVSGISGASQPQP